MNVQMLAFTLSTYKVVYKIPAVTAAVSGILFRRKREFHTMECGKGNGFFVLSGTFHHFVNLYHLQCTRVPLRQDIKKNSKSLTAEEEELVWALSSK